LNSGEHDDTQALTRFYLPLLAVAGVGLVLLYAVLLVAGLGARYFMIEWAGTLLLLVFCARAVLADYGRWVRMGFFLFFAAAIPGALIAAGVFLRNREITVHAFILFGLCMLGWKLLEPVVEQCTGHTGRQPARRKKFVFVPTFPYLDIYETTEPGGLAFSGDALVTLVVFGTLIFAAGDYLRLSQGYRNIFSPMPFALGFYAIAGGLMSLSKLVQRVRETPGSVRLEGGFLRSWAGAMLAVLAICALLAYFLPKTPVIGTGSWMARGMNDRAQQYKNRFNLPESKTTYDFSHNPQGTAPLGGHGSADSPGVGKVPGASQRAVGPDPRPTQNPKDRALDLLYNAATSFEGNAPGQQAGSPQGGQSSGNAGQNNAGGTTPGKGSPSKQNGHSDASGKNGGSGQSNQSNQSGKSGNNQQGASSRQPPQHGQSNNKLRQLGQALKNRPDRLLKLLLFLLLALLAAFAVALLLFRVIRRYIWYGLATLFRLLWGWLRERGTRLLAPFRARIRQARRERRIQQLMADMQPFAYPFADAESKSNDDIARAAYAAFLAHLWTLGYERREAETDFDFASRLARQTKLDERAVMTITLGCVRSEFSPTPLSAAELAQVQTAFVQLIDAITSRILEDARPEKMAAYCRLQAERQLAREELRDYPEPAEPVPASLI